MQAFGGAERVEDFDAEALTEALEERRGKRFASGNGVANAGEIEIGTAGAMVIEQSGVICGHREEESGAIALDIGTNAGGRWTSGAKNCGGAAGKREVAGVTQTVREKKASDAQAAVAFVDFEDGVGVVVGADHHVVMKVHASFGDSGGAGRVEPEGRVILGGGRRSEVGRGGFHQIVETLVVLCLISRGDHNDFAEMREILAWNGLELREQ